MQGKKAKTSFYSFLRYQWLSFWLTGIDWVHECRVFKIWLCSFGSSGLSTLNSLKRYTNRHPNWKSFEAELSAFSRAFTEKKTRCQRTRAVLFESIKIWIFLALSKASIWENRCLALQRFLYFYQNQKTTSRQSLQISFNFMYFLSKFIRNLTVQPLSNKNPCCLCANYSLDFSWVGLDFLRGHKLYVKINLSCIVFPKFFVAESFVWIYMNSSPRNDRGKRIEKSYLKG